MKDERIEEIRKAMFSIPYRKMTGRVDALARKIISLQIRRGYSEKPEDAERKAKLLDADINRMYGMAITWLESQVALEWGALGEYGEVRSLSADTLFGFVRSYLNSDIRQSCLRAAAADRKAEAARAVEGYPPRQNWEAFLSYIRDLWLNPDELRTDEVMQSDEIVYKGSTRICMNGAWRWLTEASGLVTAKQVAWAQEKKPGEGMDAERLTVLLAGLRATGRDLALALDNLERSTPPEQRYWI